MVHLKSYIALFILLSFGIYPQTPVSKGVYSIYGSLSYSNISIKGNYSEDSESRFNLNPGADYFIIDNLALGIAINYNRSSFDNFLQYSIGAGPAVKYFFNSGNVIPFIGGSYNYTRTYKSSLWRYGPDIEVEPYKGYTNVFSFFGGIEYLIIRNVALEAKVSYSFYKEKDEVNLRYADNNYTTKIFAVGIGINVFIY